MSRFDDKKVFISGASRGIGRAIAEVFISEGATVFGTATSIESDLKAVGVHESIIVDFSIRSEIERCAQFVRQHRPDIVINNAGINNPSLFEEIDPDDFLQIQLVNVFAPMAICQAAIPGMREKGWGRIVNIASVFSKVSKEHRAPYSASKFALDGLTLSLAIEHSAAGILANCVSPGFIDTDMTRRILGDEGIQEMLKSVPIGRLAQPAEIAQLVLWLSSPENTFLTGQNIAIDGGFTRA
ncbi:MAG: SDR family oxidoreductase [Ilumatobacteraceae bacterium]